MNPLENFSEHRQCTITTEGLRLDVALAQGMDISRSRAQALLKEGRVSLNGALIQDASLKVKTDDILELYFPTLTESTLPPCDLPLEIIFEDEHLLVLNKHAGLTVHPGAGTGDDTLVHRLIAHCGSSLSGIGGEKRPGIVHRIDKETSGLLVVAKHDKAHIGLAEQFAAHSTLRTYRAIVWGTLSQAASPINKAIGRHHQNRQKMTVLKYGGREAVTHFSVKKLFPPLASFIECRLETGRTHQIRVHLSSIGHTILGDPLYGRSPHKEDHRMKKLKALPLWGKRQMLQAASLGFIHPISSEELFFQLDMSPDLDAVIKVLESKDVDG